MQRRTPSWQALRSPAARSRNYAQFGRHAVRIVQLGPPHDDATIENATMANAFGILGGIILVCAIIALLDWLGRRKERQSKQRPVT
jgi:hypothetical protein